MANVQNVNRTLNSIHQEYEGTSFIKTSPQSKDISQYKTKGTTGVNTYV